MDKKLIHIGFWVFIIFLYWLAEPWNFYGGIAVYLILAYSCYFLYRYFKKRKESQNEIVNKVTGTPYNSVIFENFKALGSTIQEREKNINRLFDEKKQSMHFQWHWVHSEKYKNDEGHWRTDDSCYKTISLSRNLASMDAKEREFLRIVFHLFNEGKITESNYCYFLLAFVYGNGKAAIIHHKNYGYSEHSGVKDGPTTVRYIVDHWDASVDSAVNHMLRNISDLQNGSNISNSLKKAVGHIQGGGTWLTEEEIESSIFKNHSKYGLTLGALDESQKPVQYSGEGSLITIAPPGSGKTQCFVIPNMLNWKGAALVLDIKGEIYAATHKWRKRNVGKIYKFSPLDPKNSNCYNPLDFVRSDSDYIWEDARFLADMMIVPSGAQDPFWENMARDVLTAAIAHIVDDNEEGDRSMSKVLDIIYGIGWDEMIMALKLNVSVSSMKRMGNALGEIDPKQKDSILKSAQSSLSAWQGERLAKVTNKSDWNPLDLRKGSPTIYICINPNEIDSYLSVIRVFIAQHIRMLTTELPDNDAAPVLFMLDELPRLKKMPPVDEALNIGRQYGIKLWMFAQSYGQLKEAYSNPEGLVGSCAVRTFMNLPLSDEFTTKLSDQLGYRHDALSNTKEKLVEPVELSGPNYENLIIVMATGTKPAKLKKKFAYQDKSIQDKINGQIEL